MLLELSRRSMALDKVAGIQLALKGALGAGKLLGKAALKTPGFVIKHPKVSTAIGATGYGAAHTAKKIQQARQGLRYNIPYQQLQAMR